MISYSITPLDPKAHLFAVSLNIQSPQQPFQYLRLPNWIPGSYLIRDFAKHLSKLEAQDSQGNRLEVEVLDKSNWRIANHGKALQISYQVYAWDLSVRGAHFDESHGFFNGTSMFIEVVGQQDQVCRVEIAQTEFCRQQRWKVATGMPAQKTDKNGFGLYQAENYAALIDYPVEMGTFKEISFEACGIPHRMVITGVFDCDYERLTADLIKICETEIKLFKDPPPMQDYLFQVMVTGSDYGGLEHRNSTALICSRNDLPYHGMEKATDGYLQFLELCSHEYFHSWNVKRIQPKAYQLADLQTPVYTTQLWWFEGVTSYYDSLILLRAGVIDQPTYLSILAKQMTRVYRMPGRFKQSVADSSWLTWTKFYQQDENAPNAIISYYTKGSLIALALDLMIREQNNNQKSLDDVLLFLWHNFGKKQIGLEDGQIEEICSEVAGMDLSEFFASSLFATDDIDFANLFAKFGIDFKLRPAGSLADQGGSDSDAKDNYLANALGANVVDSGNNSIKLTHVWHNQAAYHAGLSAADEIIAINGLRMQNKAQLEQLMTRNKPGANLSCHYFRRDELRATELSLTEAPADRVVLSINETKTELNWLPV
ncbi:M61 family metallopeptidase [Thiomicrorhabdus sediminis]|nr:PDZ domain-containing protein [Thiomicrorhabdus sediminis]